MFNWLGKKEQDPTSVIQDQVHLNGMALENAVRNELGMGPDWDLDQMTALFIRLSGMGLSISLHTCRSGWACDVKKGEGPEPFLREYSNVYPGTALARAAVAAVRTWPC